jgi:hypothetical protein
MGLASDGLTDRTTRSAPAPGGKGTATWNLSSQRSHEPAVARSPRSLPVARQIVRKQDAHRRGHLYPHAPRAAQMGQALRSPAEAPGAARPQPLHAKASQSGAGRECRPLCRDVERSVGRAGEVFSSRRLARPWPPNAAMLAYMLSHDAHQRGQVCMLAHQLGFRLPVKAAYGIWNWEKLWRDCGFNARAQRIS